jgi:hypothetical protein
MRRVRGGSARSAAPPAGTGLARRVQGVSPVAPWRAPEEIAVKRPKHNAIQLLEALWDRADEAAGAEEARRRRLDEDAARRMAEWLEALKPAA